MRLAYVTVLYPEYVGQFYGERPGLALKPYAEQLAALQADASGWVGSWADGLGPLGYEVSDFLVNVGPLQQAWVCEHARNGPAATDEDDIALAQLVKFQPDIVWLDRPDPRLAQAIREKVASVRLVIGWIGSAVPEHETWAGLDLVLSCAPESVRALRARGLRAEHLNHAFPARVPGALGPPAAKHGVTFVGQIFRHAGYHLEREAILRRLARSGLPFAIYTPSHRFGLAEDALAVGKMAAYGLAAGMRAAGVPEALLAGIPGMGRALRWKSRPRFPVDHALKPHLRPGVFGLAMYRVLRDSEIVLNIHADSSPEFASNMRLFEITGVGSCMLTDWRANLAELFEPDAEVATYRSPDECLERARWLMDHPADRERIARAGQLRTSRDHTFARRAERLHQLFRQYLP